MPRLLFRNLAIVTNPESPMDSVVVRTVGFAAPEDMDLAAAMEALEIEDAEWSAHKDLGREGSTALWILTATR